MNQGTRLYIYCLLKPFSVSPALLPVGPVPSAPSRRSRPVGLLPPLPAPEPEPGVGPLHLQLPCAMPTPHPAPTPRPECLGCTNYNLPLGQIRFRACSQGTIPVVRKTFLMIYQKERETGIQLTSRLAGWLAGWHPRI